MVYPDSESGFPLTPPARTKPLRRGEGPAEVRPGPLTCRQDNDEIRMTNVEGIPKSQAPMERQQALSRSFKFRDSDFFRHWSFVIRNSASVRCWALDVGCWMFFCCSVAAWRRWKISLLGILSS